MQSSFYFSIVEHYDDSREALNHYVDDIVSERIFVERHLYNNMEEIRESRLATQEENSILALLAAMEGVLQEDFRMRVDNRRKDPISREFREIDKQAKNKTSYRIYLGRDIFPVWEKQLTGAERACMRRIQNAFNYRHWLAHGKYWEWKSGTIPTFYDLSVLAELLEKILMTH